MPTPTNPRLYRAVVAEARQKYERFPSAYASGWIAREYKKRGGKYRGRRNPKEGVTRWLRERWVQVVPWLTKGEAVACGAANRHAKACRPLVRVSPKTPPTLPELLKLHDKGTLLRLARAKSRDMSCRVYWRRGVISKKKKAPRGRQK